MGHGEGEWSGMSVSVRYGCGGCGGEGGELYSGVGGDCGGFCDACGEGLRG